MTATDIGHMSIWRKERKDSRRYVVIRAMADGRYEVMHLDYLNIAEGLALSVVDAGWFDDAECLEAGY